MATRLLNAVVTSTTSGSVSPVSGHQPTRTVFVAIAAADEVQVQISPDDTNWFDFGAQLQGPGNFTVEVSPRVYVRVDAAVNSGAVSAWVA